MITRKDLIDAAEEWAEAAESDLQAFEYGYVENDRARARTTFEALASSIVDERDAALAEVERLRNVLDAIEAP